MNRNEVKAEWRRATETLGAATTLVNNGYNSDAIARSYYAMLHAAKAGLATKEIETDSHRGVAAMFGKHLVKTGEVGPEQGKNLRRANSARQNADYQAQLQFTSDEAYRECERAHDFLTTVRQHLKRAGLHENELAGVPALPEGGTPVTARTESPEETTGRTVRIGDQAEGPAREPGAAGSPTSRGRASDGWNRD